MQYNNESTLPPRRIKKAIVKLDNYTKTGSTGGIVIDTYYFYPDFLQAPYNYTIETYPYPFNVNDKSLISINCSEKCKAGWIYTSKTNVLVDSNEPPK